MRKPPNNQRLLGRLACWGVLALIAVRLVSADVGAVSAADEPAADPPTRTATPAAATCSNAHCHGSNNSSSEVWRRASTVWASVDPHADAYLVLFQRESQRMVEKLIGDQNLDADSDAYREFVEDRCVACHATPSGPADTKSQSRARLQAGVTCGACHGEPSPWLDGHLLAAANGSEAASGEFAKSVSRPDDAGSGYWTASNPSYGLRALDDTVTRARVCVGCHVGAAASRDAPARDVNHDLIAAGHPRLAFEYTSHLANLTPHWRSPADNKSSTNPILAARHEWAVGQLVSADAAIELLLSRIDSGVWPEFSGYNCAACHHGLRGVDTRDDRLIASRVRRNTVHHWGGWYFAVAVEAAGGDPALASGVASLRKEMMKMAPDRERARSAASRARAALHQKIQELTGQPRPDGFERTLSEADGDGWDRSAQVYLLRAHLHASGVGEVAALRRAFRTLEPAGNQNAPLWLHSGQPSSESNLPAASNGPAP